MKASHDPSDFQQTKIGDDGCKDIRVQLYLEKNTLQLGSMVNGVALTIHIHECCCSIETMKQGCHC